MSETGPWYKMGFDAGICGDGLISDARVGSNKLLISDTYYF